MRMLVLTPKRFDKKKQQHSQQLDKWQIKKGTVTVMKHKLMKLIILVKGIVVVKKWLIAKII